MPTNSWSNCDVFQWNIQEVENGFIITTPNGKLVAKTKKEVLKIINQALLAWSKE